MTDGVLACLNDDEFGRALRGWKRSPPLLDPPEFFPSPFDGRTLRTRMATPRLDADRAAIAPPDFRACPHEFVEGLGPEALEYLGAVLKLWDPDDASTRITGLAVSGPDDPGLLVYDRG
jgi:hypothetical protein